MDKRKRSVIYNFYIESEVLDGMRKLKESQGISMSKVVNNLLKAYLKKKRFSAPINKIIAEIKDEEVLNPKRNQKELLSQDDTILYQDETEISN